MLFEKKLTPDYYFEAFGEITPEFLLSKGITAIISDIDNTLVPYEIREATEEVKDWIASLEKAGIKTALVSNNHAERVEAFACRLDCPAYADVGKPGIKFLLRAMEDMHSGREHTAFLGDQLLTDALAAHRAGIKMIAVPPIRDKKTLFFRFKRLLERPYMKKFFKNNGRPG